MPRRTILFGALLALAGCGGNSSTQTTTPVPITPIGRLVVATDATDGTTTYQTANLDGGNAQPLLPSVATDAGFGIARSGKVAYRRTLPTGTLQGFAVTFYDASGAETGSFTTAEPITVTGAAISDDGTQFAYAYTTDASPPAAGSETSYLRIVDRNGTVLTQSAALAGVVRPLAFLPDRSKVLLQVTKRSATATDVYLATSTPDGKTQRRITPKEFPVGSGSVSPDGKQVAFEILPTPTIAERDLGVVGVDGSDYRRLFTQEGDERSPAFDLTSTRVYFRYEQPNGGIAELRSELVNGTDLQTVPLVNGRLVGIINP